MLNIEYAGILITEIKMRFEKKEHKKFKKVHYPYFVLAGDIGGTNTNVGIFGVRKNPVLLLSFHFKSNEVKGLHNEINGVLEHAMEEYGIKITKACLAVAGVLSQSRESAKITNVKLDISRKMLLKKTKLKKIALTNDFEAIGHGIGMLGRKGIAVIKKAKKIPKAPILIIGAGTGLGKATLIYNWRSKSYDSIPSEAGHSDFAAQTQMEINLINFIKKYKNIAQAVSYEQVLSGPGLASIYLFLRKSGKFKETAYTREIGANPKPELISKYRKADRACRETFQIFKEIYARFAKNFAIDSLAFGGVYIAGGIAPKNRDIFDKGFVRIFENNYKLAYVLRKIPVYLVLNSDVGLLGAGSMAKFL